MKTDHALRRLTAADPFAGGLADPSLEAMLRRLDGHEPPVSLSPRVPKVSDGRRRPLTWAGPMIGVLVAAAVIVAAVVLVGRRAAPLPTAGSLRSRPVLSQFAILRRTQTPHDRQLPPFVKTILATPPQGHQLLSGLTRMVGALPGRGAGRVLLVVIAHGPSPRRPHDVWLLMITAAHGGGGGVAGSPYAGDELFPQVGQGYAAELVPDAVTRVKWTFPGRTVYPTIRDNVAVAPASIPSGRGPGLTSVTWYGPARRVLAYEDAQTLLKHQAASDRRAIARQISPILLRRLTILNEPHTLADQLPHPLQVIVARDRDLAPWLSQRVDVPHSRLAEWIVPGRHRYCRFDTERLAGRQVASPALAEHCVAASSLLADAITLDPRGTALVQGPTPNGAETLATGVVPNSVTSAIVTRANGTSASTPIHDDVIAARVRSGDRVYLLTAGHKDLALAVPPRTH